MMSLENIGLSLLTWDSPRLNILSLALKFAIKPFFVSRRLKVMKLTPTQRLLACTAMKIKQEELKDLLGLSNLPQSIKDEVSTPIVFLTKLRQNCGSIQAFILKLREMLTMTSMFSDLRNLVERLCGDCREGDLRMTSSFPVGMAAHRPSPRQKEDFNRVLFRVSEMIPRETLSVMVTVTPIPDGKKERMSKGYELFEEMQLCGFISENDTEFLEDLLRVLNLTKPLEVLELYKQEHPPIQYDSFSPQQPMPRSSQASGGSFATLPSPRPQNVGVARYGSLPEGSGSSRQPSAVVGGNGYYTRSVSAEANSLASGNYGSFPSDAGSLQSGNYSLQEEGGGSGPPGLNLYERREGEGHISLPARSGVPVPHDCLQRHVQKSKSLQISSPPPSSRQNGTMVAVPHDNIYPGRQVHLSVQATPPGSLAKANGTDPEPSAPPPYNPHFTVPPAPLPPQHAELEPTVTRQPRRDEELAHPSHHEQAAKVTGSTLNTEDGESTLASMGSTVSSFGEASLQSYKSSNMHNGHSQLLPHQQRPQQREVSGPKRYVHGSSSLELQQAQTTANVREIGGNSPSEVSTMGSIPSSEFQSEPRPSHLARPQDPEVLRPQERQSSGPKGWVQSNYSSPKLPHARPATNLLQSRGTSNTPSQSAAAFAPSFQPQSRPSDPLPSARRTSEVSRKPQERETTGPKKCVHSNFSSPQPPPGQPAANVWHGEKSTSPSQAAATAIPSSQVNSEPGVASYQRPPTKKSAQSSQKPKNAKKSKNNPKKEMSLRQRQNVLKNFNQNIEKSVAPSSVNLDEQSTVMPPFYPPPAKRPNTNQAGSEALHQHRTMASPVPPATQTVTTNKYASPLPNMAHRSMESISSSRVAQCSDTQTSLYPSVPSGSSGNSLGDDRRMTRSSRKRDAEALSEQSNEITSKRSRTEELAAPKEAKQGSGFLGSLWSLFSRGKKKEEVNVNTSEHDDDEYHSCEEEEQ